MRVVVVTASRLSQSPRACAQAAAFARAGAQTTLMGFADDADGGGDDDDDDEEGKVARFFLPRIDAAWRGHLPGPLFVVVSTLRAMVQGAALGLALLRLRADLTVVEVPPVAPVVLVARLVCALTKARLCIDWHNLSSSVLALRLGVSHAAVRVLRSIERDAARSAVHLAVTDRLRDHLLALGARDVVVFEDRPRACFQPADHRGATRARLAAELDWPELAEPARLWLVAPTSFTPDEDFDLLVTALEKWDRRDVVDLVVLVTGRGPGQAAFAQCVEDAGLRRSRVRLAWLAEADYAAALAAADLGLSLHRSASGLDRPMKVLDMIGAGLPVLALDAGGNSGVRDLVDKSGGAHFFDDAEGLVAALQQLSVPAARERLRQALPSLPSFEEHWQQVVGPLLLEPR